MNLVIRQRYSVSEIIATQEFTLFNIDGVGYAVKHKDYTCAKVSSPLYKFHKGQYHRCYGDVEKVDSYLHAEVGREWNFI